MNYDDYTDRLTGQVFLRKRLPDRRSSKLALYRRDKRRSEMLTHESHSSSTRFTARMFCCVLTAVLFATAHGTMAAPIVDGRFDPAEGYTSVKTVMYDGGPKNVAAPGTLWMHTDPATGDLWVAFLQPRILVDNTYGANLSPQWGTKDRPFDKIVGSDSGKFIITDASGNDLLKLEIDYIEDDGTDALGRIKYVSQLKKTDPKNVTPAPQVGTSLDYNFNTLGIYLPVDSPPIGPNYLILDPSHNGWIFDSIYEFKIDGSFFASAGFGDVLVDKAHNSPHTGQVPEPATISLLALGALAAVRRRRRS